MSVCVCVSVRLHIEINAEQRDHKTQSEHDKKTTKLTHLQSQKTLLVAAAHGALPRLEHIDGVYVRQDVLECELQVWPYRLHNLYQ